MSLFGFFGEKRKVAVKTKAVAIPISPTKRSGLGLVVSPWVWYPRWRKSSFLMALAPPWNSLFLPPELVGSKH